jgi:Oxidoreductase family, NAD-binding Rossmann fold
LRWGILGSGWIAERFIESVRAHTKQDILAVGSRSKDRAKEFASRMALKQAYGDYEEFVAADDLDVIYVATPHNLHHEGVTLALNAGKHVLVEKPIALNRVQALKWWNWLAGKGSFSPKRFGRFTFLNSMCFANSWKPRPSVRSVRVYGLDSAVWTFREGNVG